MTRIELFAANGAGIVFSIAPHAWISLCRRDRCRILTIRMYSFRHAFSEMYFFPMTCSPKMGNHAHDLRGRFPRAWSNGSNVDAGRAFGSAQEDAIRNIIGGTSTSPIGVVEPSLSSGAFYTVGRGNIPSGIAGGGVWSASSFNFDASRVVPTADEIRVKNTALFLSVKF